MIFYDFEAPEKNKHSPVRRRPQQLPAQLVFTWASMRKNALRKTLIGLGPDVKITGNLILNIILKIEYMKIKVAGELIKDNKGWYIHL